jgi:lysozyme family protein
MTDTEIIEAILRREGVYDDNPNDPGGKTAYGISIVYHPEAWSNGRPTRDAAIAIYKRDYLAPFASIEPVTLKAQVVDIAVNCGVTAARGMLAMAQQQTKRPVSVQLVIERLKHYGRKVKASPSKAEFIGGWINRSVEFL